MAKKFTTKRLEDLIRLFKKMVHEPHGKPVPRGVARLWQSQLESLRDEWKKQAQTNKAKKKKSIRTR
jgi:hypothetical protein